MLSRSFTRREQLIMASLAAAIVVGAGVIVWQSSADEGLAMDAVAPLLDSTPTARAAEPDIESATPGAGLGQEPESLAPSEAAKVTVAVRGAVKYPGLYELAEGRRVDDLIDRAGGVSESADMRDINIAAPLIDGSTLTVPSFPDPETGQYDSQAYPAHATLNPSQYTVSGWQPGAARTAAASSPGGASGGGGGAAGRIDLNRATQAELETLPGIGPVTANSIIAYREQMPFQAVEELEQVSGIGPKRLEAVRDLVTVSGR